MSIMRKNSHYAAKLMSPFKAILEASIQSTNVKGVFGQTFHFEVTLLLQ